MNTKILVPIDLEHVSTQREVLRVAEVIANSEGAQVELLTVVEATPVLVSEFLPKQYEQNLSQTTRDQLETLAASMKLAGSPATFTVRFGSVYREILALREILQADLIVMGSHEPTVADYLLGSNAARVVRHAPCSVFIVRPPQSD